MQTEKYDYINREVVRLEWDIVDYTKTEMGERTLYLNKEARKVLNLIRETNE